MAVDPAGENPAQSAALAGSRGMLFGVQLNDGYQRLGAEDGLIFGWVGSLAPVDLTGQNLNQVLCAVREEFVLGGRGIC